MQIVGMLGLTQSFRRTLGWALRLMFQKIERRTVPPQTQVPMRQVGCDPSTVAAHAPVRLTVSASTRAGEGLRKAVALPVAS
jgi:hypothetical protein